MSIWYDALIIIIELQCKIQWNCGESHEVSEIVAILQCCILTRYSNSGKEFSEAKGFKKKKIKKKHKLLILIYINSCY